VELQYRPDALKKLSYNIEKAILEFQGGRNALQNWLETVLPEMLPYTPLEAEVAALVREHGTKRLTAPRRDVLLAWIESGYADPRVLAERMNISRTRVSEILKEITQIFPFVDDPDGLETWLREMLSQP